MSTVHRTIIAIRSLFGGLDASVPPGLIDGKNRNANADSKALDRQDVTPDVRNLLEKQRLRIDAAITRMKGLVTVS